VVEGVPAGVQVAIQQGAAGAFVARARATALVTAGMCLVGALLS
jgi:hypothetical protein